MTNAADRLSVDRKVSGPGTKSLSVSPPSPADDYADDKLFVTSVEKAFSVLQAFYNESGALTLTEIAARTGMGKSAAQRFCHTLVRLGYLDRVRATRQLKPSMKLLDFSYICFAGNPLNSVASPFLLRARELCGEALNLSLPMGLDVMYVIRIPSPNAPLTSPIVGGRAPIYCTASGRAYLSTLTDEEALEIIRSSPRQALTSHTLTEESAILERIAQARMDGYTIAVEECIYGEVTIAAPIWGRGHRGIGSINICVTRPNWTQDRVRDELAPVVCQTAHEISQALAASMP